MNQRTLLIALAAVAALAVAVGASFALLSSSRGDPLGSAQPDPPTESNLTATPGASPTPDVGARPVTVGPDIEFPPDTAMWVVLGPWGKGTGPFSILRAYRIGEDPVQMEVLFPPAAVEGNGYAGNVDAAVVPTGFMVHPTTDALVAAICYGEGCGHEGGPNGLPARTVFYESPDGGSSWSQTYEREGEWWPVTFHREQLLARDYSGSEPGGVLVPSGEPFTWPEGLEPWPGPPLFPGGDARYSDSNGDSIVNDVPAVEFRPDVPIDFRLTLVHPLKEGMFFAAAFLEKFDEEGYDPSTPFPLQRSFLGLFGPKGVVRELYELPRSTGATGFAGLLDTDRTHALGTFSYTDRPATCTSGGTNSGSAPAIFDTETGVVQFIPDPFLNPACPGGSHTVIAFQQGDLARVDTPGDCLNVRELPEASAPIITCLPHGAIVRNQGALWHGQWTNVTLFDGREGFASVEYLDKGARRRLSSAAIDVLQANLPSAPDRIVGPCIDFDDTPTEGWCYQRVEVEGDTVRLELGIVAS
ncbi:MAG: SH3 domain-containing protein, partial [Tepidiformaceae bacterium]